MSTLVTATVKSNSSSPVAFQNSSGTEIGTLCRAWVNFNGTFATSPFTTANGGIRAAFNVSSITDNDVGNYTVNLTNAMSDTNYAAIASTSDNATLCGVSPARETKTSSTFSIITREVAGSGNRYDPTQVSASVFA